MRPSPTSGCTTTGCGITWGGGGGGEPQPCSQVLPHRPGHQRLPKCPHNLLGLLGWKPLADILEAGCRVEAKNSTRKTAQAQISHWLGSPVGTFLLGPGMSEVRTVRPLAAISGRVRVAGVVSRFLALVSCNITASMSWEGVGHHCYLGSSSWGPSCPTPWHQWSTPGASAPAR